MDQADLCQGTFSKYFNTYIIAPPELVSVPWRKQMSSSDDCNQAAIHSYVRVVLEWDTAWEYFGAVGMASNTETG